MAVIIILQTMITIEINNIFNKLVNKLNYKIILLINRDNKTIDKSDCYYDETIIVYKGCYYLQG